ncbi:hypothetical protein MBLNU457_3349t1 [Dothideomycetes sp. NU457]
MGNEQLISVEEISKHNTSEDCWIVVDGKVWDMTEFAPQHPGGPRIITKHAGRDASTSYNEVHAPSVLPENLSPDKYKGRLDTSTITEDWTKPPPDATPQLQLHEKPPMSSILNAHDFEEVAERTLTKKTWAFYSSAATDCITRDRNATFFSRIWFRPRALRNVSKIDTRSKMLGHDIDLPLFISPAAMAKLVNPEGEKALAAGSVKTRIPQCISTSASFPAEDIVAAAPKDHPFFFQLYVNKERQKTEALLHRVWDLGIRTIFVTVDAPVPGKREADERVKADEGLSSAIAGTSASNDAKGGGLGRTIGTYIDDSLSWDDLPWLRKHFKGKIVIKGIQSAMDAKACADAGLDGVLLSNHGGRCLDTSPPAIMVLVECQRVCPEIFDKMEVFVDSGIRRGTDLVKCLCLGATAVGMGRSFLFSLNYGKEGVEHLIEIMRDEVEITMKMLGVTNISQLHPGLVSTLDVDGLVSTTPHHPYAQRPRERVARL